MMRSTPLTRSRVPPESVGRDVARLLASTYAGLLDDDVPETFASILRRMENPGGQDVARRLIDLAGSEAAEKLSWASYERLPGTPSPLNPRWRLKSSVPVRH